MDYYEILGLESNATQQEIKSAYHKLAARYHPDVNDAANASAFFRLLNEAFETLSNADKRKEYDGRAKDNQPSSSRPKTDSKSYYAETFNCNFHSENVISVRRTWLFIMLIPLKIIAAVLLLISMFLQAISLILASITNTIGGIIMILSVIGSIFSVCDSGFTKELIIPVIAAIFGFLMALIGAGLPAVFEFLSDEIKAFINYIPTKTIVRERE